MDLDVIHSPWAVRKELLPAIAAALTGRVTGAVPAAEMPAPEAALGAPPLQQSIAVIPLQGVITPRPSPLAILFGGGGGLQMFRSQLREAVASDEVGAILINVDSPGGRLDLVTETAAEIRAAAAQKTVVAVANTSAASAAYWLASQATELVVTPSGQIGSVGVYSIHEDWSAWNENVGVDITYIYAGAHKVEGNPDEPLSEEAREYIQARVDEGRDQFAADVAKARGVTTAVVKGEEFGEGRMYGAKEAVKRGMADRVETLEAAIARLAKGSGGGSRRAEGLQFTDHIASVVAEVDGVISRTADVKAMRAEKGKGLGSGSEELLTELDARLDQLRGLLASEPSDIQSIATAAEREYLHTVRRSIG
jgi:capsid assembly protease